MPLPALLPHQSGADYWELRWERGWGIGSGRGKGGEDTPLKTGTGAVAARRSRGKTSAASAEQWPLWPQLVITGPGFYVNIFLSCEQNAAQVEILL